MDPDRTVRTGTGRRHAIDANPLPGFICEICRRLFRRPQSLENHQAAQGRIAGPKKPNMR
ncbi:hypothetical protein FJ930_04425 [Mesorhizobium sp. B2-4-15]|nr:hypothetical protein FJ930_04425 [Mesorhizobium sp. B2-4-15]